VERRRQFEAEQTDVTIVPPARPDDRWRAILPLGVLPDDGTTIGARSLCDLMDKLDALYPVRRVGALAPLPGCLAERWPPRRPGDGQRDRPLVAPELREARGLSGRACGICAGQD
jgi:hypothetical protein